MQQLYLKNLNKWLLLVIILLLFSCVTPNLVNAKLPLREAKWAKVIEAQYPLWRRPKVKINPTEVVVEPKVKGYRQPPPIEQARFIPASIVPNAPKSVRKPKKPSSIKSSPRNNKPRYYTVKKGDVLSSIARKVYGKAYHWKKIYDANRNVLASPNQVKVGQKLLLP